MTRPKRALTMAVAARRTHRKVPCRLVSTTAEKSSSDMRMSSVSLVIPALATSTSMSPPSSSLAAAKARPPSRCR